MKEIIILSVIELALEAMRLYAQPAGPTPEQVEATRQRIADVHQRVQDALTTIAGQDPVKE